MTESGWKKLRLSAAWVIPLLFSCKPVLTVSPTPISSPSPTSTPSGGGGSTTRQNLIFEADFEGSKPFQGKRLDGNGNVTGFVNMAEGRQFCCNDSVTQVSGGFESDSAVLMTQRGTNDPPVSSGYRAELTPNVDDSGEKWYGWAMYFEGPVSNGNWSGDYNGHFVQWHPDNSTGSASLSLWGGGKIDVCTNPSGGAGCTHNDTGVRIKANTWHSAVFHVNWETGFVEFWWDGQKVFSKTVSRFTGQYMKLGVNRWLSTQVWRIRYDSLRIGNKNATYNDVAP